MGGLIDYLRFLMGWKGPTLARPLVVLTGRVAPSNTLAGAVAPSNALAGQVRPSTVLAGRVAP